MDQISGVGHKKKKQFLTINIIPKAEFLLNFLAISKGSKTYRTSVWIDWEKNLAYYEISLQKHCCGSKHFRVKPRAKRMFRKQILRHGSKKMFFNQVKILLLPGCKLSLLPKHLSQLSYIRRNNASASMSPIGARPRLTEAAMPRKS